MHKNGKRMKGKYLLELKGKLKPGIYITMHYCLESADDYKDTWWIVLNHVDDYMSSVFNFGEIEWMFREKSETLRECLDHIILYVTKYFIYLRLSGFTWWAFLRESVWHAHSKLTFDPLKGTLKQFNSDLKYIAYKPSIFSFQYTQVDDINITPMHQWW